MRENQIDVMLERAHLSTIFMELFPIASKADKEVGRISRHIGTLSSVSVN